MPEALKLMTTMLAESVDKESWDDRRRHRVGGGRRQRLRHDARIRRHAGHHDHRRGSPGPVRSARAHPRAAWPIQVSVESRIMLVSNNFLDDFGIGWNLNINQGAASAAACRA